MAPAVVAKKKFNKYTFVSSKLGAKVLVNGKQRSADSDSSFAVLKTTIKGINNLGSAFNSLNSQLIDLNTSLSKTFKVFTKSDKRASKNNLDSAKLSAQEFKLENKRESDEKIKSRRSLDASTETRSERKDPFGLDRDKKEKVEIPTLGLFDFLKNFIQLFIKYAITSSVLKWMMDPKNTEKIGNMFKAIRSVFKFIWDVTEKLAGFITGAIVNLGSGVFDTVEGLKKGDVGQVLNGLGQVLTAIPGLLALNWLLNPMSLFKDIGGILGKESSGPSSKGNNQGRTGVSGNAPGRTPTTSSAAARRYAERYGIDAARKRFGKDAVKSLGGKYARSGATNLARKTLVGTLGKGGAKQVLKFTKPFLKRLPIVGALIDFGLSVALGEPLGRAAFKSIGAFILGAIGTGFGGPLGAIIGGFAGDWVGGKLYDVFFSKKTDGKNKPPEFEEGGIVRDGKKLSPQQVGGVLVDSTTQTLSGLGPGGKVAEQFLGGEISKLQSTFGQSGVLINQTKLRVSTKKSNQELKDSKDGGMSQSEGLIGKDAKPSITVGQVSGDTSVVGLLASVVGVLGMLVNKDFNKSEGGGQTTTQTTTGNPPADQDQESTGQFKATDWNKDPAFASAVNDVAKHFNVSANDLLGLMASESGLNPQAVNSSSGATGLIQFIPSTAASIGTSTTALRKMNRVQQMPYVKKYLESVGLPKGATAGHLYTAVFLPAFVKKPANYVVAKKGGFTDDWGKHPASWYSGNSGLDMNRDNSITIAELGERIQKKKKAFGIPMAAGGNLSLIGGNRKGKIDRGGSDSEDKMLQQFAKGGKIFLHWTAGGYSFKSKGHYHGIVQGDGSIYKAHPYDQRSGVSHTYNRNGQGVGLSIAAMGGQPDPWSMPPKGIQLENLSKEIANIGKSWGWGPNDISIKTVMTHAEAASNKDGVVSHDNYGPRGWGGTGERWDLWQIKKGEPNGSGGDKIRAMARGFMGGDSTVKYEAGGSNQGKQTTSQDSSSSPGSPSSSQPAAAPEKNWMEVLADAFSGKTARDLVSGTSSGSGASIPTSGSTPTPVTPTSGGSYRPGSIPSSGSLNIQQLVSLSLKVGFKGRHAAIAAAVAWAESTGNPNAHNKVPPDNSYGLWQINMIGNLGPARRKQWGLNNNEELFNPETNAKIAYKISGGVNFSAWTTYTGGKYKAHLANAEKALASLQTKSAAGGGIIDLNNLNFKIDSDNKLGLDIKNPFKSPSSIPSLSATKGMNFSNTSYSPQQQKIENGKGMKLTPMQQWAKNFPEMAKKVKPGQSGYEEIQAYLFPNKYADISKKGFELSSQGLNLTDIKPAQTASSINSSKVITESPKLPDESVYTKNKMLILNNFRKEVVSAPSPQIVRTTSLPQACYSSFFSN